MYPTANGFEVTICEKCGSTGGCVHYQSGRVHETTVEEILISLVEARPPLWDSRLPSLQRSNHIKDKLWLEIYNELGENPVFSVDYLQRKWETLCHTFIKIKSEQDAYGSSGSTGKKKKLWEHFEHMKFLELTIIPRASTSNHQAEASLPSVSTASTSDQETTPYTSRTQITKNDAVENAILNGIQKVSSTAIVAPSVNPICIRISQILDQMPPRERAKLEIALLIKAYEAAEQYL